MADVFSLVMAIVCVVSAIFILILVASFAWVCVRALAIEDNLVDFNHDLDAKLMREPLVENIFAQDLRTEDNIAPCTSV